VSRRRAPRSLAAALGSALERAEPATLLAAVQRSWPEAVGEAIAREAAPVSERDGVVTVACRSATWAQELDLLSDQILARIREKVASGGALRGLRFNASGDFSENLG
jgi:predicted nucleic acid-binding Zn ribbon protein